MTRSVLSCVITLSLMACGNTDRMNGGTTTPGSCLSGCAAGFSCQGGICRASPTAQWSITLASGRINERKPDGTAWDVPGGLPDPFVCLTLSGQRQCSSVQTDTLLPAWDEQLAQGTTTALAAGLQVEIGDKDLAFDDPICGAATIPVTESSLLNGRWELGCTSASISFSVRAR